MARDSGTEDRSRGKSVAVLEGLARFDLRPRPRRANCNGMGRVWIVAGEDISLKGK